MKKPLLLFLALLLLAGCTAKPPEEVPTELVPLEETPPEEVRYTLPTEPVSRADRDFTLQYDPTAPIDPLSGTNLFNNTLCSLLYEGLVRLNARFEPEPLLCTGWTTEDGVNWLFTLREDVLFTDGTPLTAADVVYSVNRAAGANKLGRRFLSVRAVSAQDEHTVAFVLHAPNYGFPARLDLPIVKENTGRTPNPVGTGPYLLGEGELTAFPQYRDYKSLSLKRIGLLHLPVAQLGMAFTRQTLDLLELDPLGTIRPSFQGDYEMRTYPTSALLALTFNTVSQAGRDPVIRRALSFAFDRAELLGLLPIGSYDTAPLILSPALSGYDPTWEADTGFDRSRFDEMLYADGVMDLDNDGFWDMSSRSGALRFRILANSETEAHGALAQAVADRLEILGFHTTLRILPYEEYAAALAEGAFDLAVTEVKLTGDLDMTPLLATDGSLNVGKAEGYDELLTACLSTQGEAHTEALHALCEQVKEDCPLIPLAYKRFEVVSHMNVIQGLEPTQSGVFWGIAGWTITP